MSASPLAVLQRLHAVDVQIHALRMRQEALPARVSEQQERITVQQKVLDDQKSRIKHDLADTHALEVELLSFEGNIKKHLIQRNAVTTNKEYKAIDHQIEVEKMEIHKTEDRVLERMEESDILLAEQKTIEAKLAEENTLLTEAENKAAQQVGQLAEQIETLSQDRQAIAAELAVPIGEKYARLLVKHPDSAICEVANDACERCYQRLTQQEINLLIGNAQIVFCRSCNRILYLEETEDF